MGTVTREDRALLERLRDLLVWGSEAEALEALADHREQGQG